MRPQPNRTFEFVMQETRTYTVQGDGTNAGEAETDAFNRFHRLRKSGDLPCDEVSKPKIVKIVLGNHDTARTPKYSK